MTDADHGPHFSPIEVGLLTIALRRGAVRTACEVDLHNEPAEIERMTVLRRLVERGLMRQVSVEAEANELVFAITDDGRRAVESADRTPVPPEH
jgi:hypothetical protein